MDFSDSIRAILTSEEKQRISQLISTCRYSNYQSINSFERRFLEYLRGDGPKPTTNFGIAWVKYARSLPEYRRLFFTSIYSGDCTGHDTNGFKKGIHWLTNSEFDEEGFDSSGYNLNGYDRSGRDKNGFDINGYNKNGFKKDGFNDAGVDQYGYDKEGFKDGMDRNGFNRDGYNIKGFNKSGIHIDTGTPYDKTGYDKDGYNKDGFNINGYNRAGIDKHGKKPISWCSCGGGMPNCYKCGGRGYTD